MATIINGLFSGRSGIQSHGAAISVLADNIANANTVGFKASRADFVDLLAGNLSSGGATTAVGSGSSVQKITQIFDQGTFEFTNRGLDLGIDGNGFFVVQDNAGTRYYSRAGNFEVEADGSLLNQNGFKVMGFPTGGTGGLEELNVNQLTQDSVATTKVTISGNLDASATALTGGAGGIPGAGATLAQLNTAAEFSTSVDVFDSLGAVHAVTVYFFKTGSGAWEARGYVDASNIQGGTPGDPAYLGRVAMGFDANGNRTDVNTFTIDPTFGGLGGWESGAGNSAITIELDPFTQFSANSSITSISQDGTGGGSVVSFNVEPDGTLFALLDNGQTSSIGTIALATFANPEGLKRQGESLYVNSTTSGEPVFGRPQSGQFGGIQAGALELSTADIAGDFIKLISLQRGFQGSSRVITSINDLLQEIMNLAR